jgi:hypothetical protein|tara:strand:+ start:1272 stop:1445 length:174 start_codon:yes stop_codon:yes gene_type:complete
MPFKSQAQRAYMYKNLPEIAEQWEKETTSGVLPKRIHPKKPKRSLLTQRRRRRKVRR